MKTFNIHEAKTHFSKLVDQAAAGKEIVIAKAGKPVAKLVSLQAKTGSPTPPRKLGLLKGQMKLREDFYDPLPDDILDAFYPRADEGR
jgi:prevent-host-death family protein